MQDGHPPLGWTDTAAYLVLPVLLVVSQYVSMEIMKPPQVKKWISSLAFSACNHYSSKWFFNPELFWFDRQMIQLKRTHFLFSSFYLLWLVTSLYLFHRDYLYTGSFLIINVTQLNLFMFCIHVFSFNDWLWGSKKTVNLWFCAINKNLTSYCHCGISSAWIAPVVFMLCILAPAVIFVPYLTWKKLWAIFIVGHSGIPTGALT